MSESQSVASSDPLKAIADAMESAVQAAREGTADAQVVASQAVPAVGEFLSRATYRSCYAISYGVVFASVFVAKSIPKDNAVVHGLIDGAHAAVDMVRDMKAKPAGEPTPEASSSRSEATAAQP